MSAGVTLRWMLKGPWISKQESRERPAVTYAAAAAQPVVGRAAHWATQEERENRSMSRSPIDRVERTG